MHGDNLLCPRRTKEYSSAGFEDVSLLRKFLQNSIFLTVGLLWIIPSLSAAPVEVILQSEPTGSYSAQLSPDGRYFATASEDNSVRLWDTRTFRIIRYFNGHQGDVRNVAFSRDGKRLITASANEDNPVRIWDVETGAESKSFFDPDGYSANAHWAEFDVDTRQYITLFGSRASVKSAVNGSILKTMVVGDGDNTQVAFAAGGKFLAAADDGVGLTLWNVDTGKRLGVLSPNELYVRSIAIAPDGSQLITGDRDGKVTLWSTTRSEQNRTLGKFAGAANSIAYSTDGGVVVVGSGDGHITAYNARTGRLLKQKTLSGASIDSISVTADGSTVLATFSQVVRPGSHDPSMPSSMILWSLRDGTEIRHTRGVSRGVTALSPSDVDNTLLSGDEAGSVRKWDMKTGELRSSLGKFNSAILGISTARDGRLIAVSKKDGVEILGGSGLNRKITSARPPVISLSPDGQIAVTGGSAPAAVWSMHDGRIMATGAAGEDIGISPDKKTFVSGENGVIEFHDSVTGRKSGEQFVSLVRMAFSPDSKKLLVGEGYPDGGPIRLLEMPSGKELQKLDGDKTRTHAVAYAPNGQTFAAGGNEKIVKIYNAWDSGGSLYRQLTGHAGSILAITFSKDSKTVYSGSEDGTIKIWDIATSRLLATLIPTADGSTITLTPEGFFDAKPGAARSLTVVQGLDVYTIDQFYEQLYRPDLVRQKLVGDPDGAVAEAAESLGLETLVGSGPPPTVSFLDKPSVHDGAVNVHVKLEDNGGGFGKVEWRVNGTTVGVMKVQGGDGSNTLSKTVYLSAGANKIEVVAYNRANLVSSEVVSLSVDVAISDTTPGRLFVIAVGASQYFDSRLSLRYALSDAETLAKALKSGSKNLYSSIETVLVADRDATKQGIDDAFQKIAAKARPQDTFVFFMAGHGITDGGKYFFLPYDFVYRDETSIEMTAIGQDQLQQWLAMIPTQRSLVLLDTCESGAMTGQDVASRGIEQAIAYERITRAMGRTTIAASSSAAPALEGYKGHGVFTYALLNALASGDTNSDGAVDVLEMIGWIDREVPILSEKAFNFRQIPQTSFSGSNFLVSARLDGPALGTAASEGDNARRSDSFVLIRNEPYYTNFGDAKAVGQLPTGTQVEVVSEGGGKALISRKGAIVGYVDRQALVALQ